MSATHKKSTLNLTLKEGPFWLMSTGIKQLEIRKPSQWIISRLENKDGTPKQHHDVLFVNGYGKQRPRFKMLYEGYIIASADYTLIYTLNSITHTYEVCKGDYIIVLGKRTKYVVPSNCIHRYTISDDINKMPQNLFNHHLLAQAAMPLDSETHCASCNPYLLQFNEVPKSEIFRNGYGFFTNIIDQI